MAKAKTPTKTAPAGADVRPEGMPEGQAPVAQATRKPLTIREKRQEIFDDMMAGLFERRADLESLLAGHGIEFDYFAAQLKTALMFTLKNDPDFFVGDNAKPGVTVGSFFAAVYKAASDGLVCDGREAAIARFGREATYMPMVGGYLKKAHQSGLIADINHQVVTEKEDAAGRFDYEEGSSGFIRHRMLLDRKDTDTIVAAYCVVRTVNGGEYREVVPQNDLKKIRSVSKALKGPRKDWPLEMDRKAPLRRVFKRIPHDKGLAQLIAHDDEAYKALPSAREVEAPDREIPTSALFSREPVHAEGDAPAEANAADDDGLPPPEDPVVEGVKSVPDEEPQRRAPPADPAKAPNQGVLIDQMMKLVQAASSAGELAAAIDDLKNHPHRADLTANSEKIIAQCIHDQHEKLGLPVPTKKKPTEGEQGTLI